MTEATSLVVLGRDVKAKAQDKILRLGLSTALGLDGLKAWIAQREDARRPEPLVSRTHEITMSIESRSES